MSRWSERKSVIVLLTLEAWAFQWMSTSPDFYDRAFGELGAFLMVAALGLAGLIGEDD